MSRYIWKRKKPFIITAQEHSGIIVLAEKIHILEGNSKNGTVQTKTYNFETELQISMKFGTDVADHLPLLCNNFEELWAKVFRVMTLKI